MPPKLLPEANLVIHLEDPKKDGLIFKMYTVQPNESNRLDSGRTVINIARNNTESAMQPFNLDYILQD